MSRVKAVLGLLAKLHTRVIATVLAGIAAPEIASLLGLRVTAPQLGGYLFAVGTAAASLQKLLSKQNESKAKALLAKVHLTTDNETKGTGMASIQSVAASPSTVAKGGGTSDIAVTVENPQTTATVTIQLDGQTGTATLELQENLVFSVTAADADKPGHVVATVDQGGTLAVGADGKSFVFTAS